MSDSKKQNAPEGVRVDLAGRLESTNQNTQPKSSTHSDIVGSRSTSTEAQRDKLLALLRINPQTTYSLRKHGLAQCAARVWGLRKEGFTILTEKVTAIDSDGFSHVGVARYRLTSEPTTAKE